MKKDKVLMSGLAAIATHGIAIASPNRSDSFLKIRDPFEELRGIDLGFTCTQGSDSFKKAPLTNSQVKSRKKAKAQKKARRKNR